MFQPDEVAAAVFVGGAGSCPAAAFATEYTRPGGEGGSRRRGKGSRGVGVGVGVLAVAGEEVLRRGLDMHKLELWGCLCRWVLVVGGGVCVVSKIGYTD